MMPLSAFFWKNDKDTESFILLFINFFQGYDGFHFHNAKINIFSIFNFEPLHSYPAVCIYFLQTVTNAIFCCVLTAASASSSGHPETPVTRGIMTSPYGMRDHTHFTHIQPPQVRWNHKHIILTIICMFRGTSINGGSFVLSQINNNDFTCYYIRIIDICPSLFILIWFKKNNSITLKIKNWMYVSWTNFRAMTKK